MDKWQPTVERRGPGHFAWHVCRPSLYNGLVRVSVTALKRQSSLSGFERPFPADKNGEVKTENLYLRVSRSG